MTLRAVASSPAAAGGGGTGFAGSGTFATMKAIAAPVDGNTFYVTNYGKGGSTWRYSTTAGDWFPTAPLKVYENTALITGLAQTAEQVLLAIPNEAGLLANKVWRILWTFGKNGTTDASGSSFLRQGNLGTTADAAITNTATSQLSAANRAIGYEQWFRASSATATTKLGGSNFVGSFNGVGNAGAVNITTAVSNLTNQLTYLVLSCSMAGTTDAPQLGYVAVEIQS